MKIHSVREDDIARLVRQMEAKGLKPWTIRGQALTPLSGIFRFAVRKGWRSDNPVVNLEADERPRVESKEKRILEVAEIHALIKATPAKYRPVIQTAVFTGLRLSELLGLRWGDVDLARGVLRVRWQVTPLGGLSEPKTATSKREVVVFPELANVLREHRLRSPFSKDEDFVFASEVGTPLMHSSVRRRGLEKGAAKLNGNGARLTMHDLRHCFASMLIREGADVVFVSRQLGHSSPAITLSIYAHLFDSEAQATQMRDALQARFGGNAVVTSDGNGREDTGTVQGENVVSMRP